MPSAPGPRQAGTGAEGDRLALQLYREGAHLGNQHGHHTLRALQVGIQTLCPDLVVGQAAEPDTEVHQVVDLVYDVQ